MKEPEEELCTATIHALTWELTAGWSGENTTFMVESEVLGRETTMMGDYDFG
jgi:hypothetical protein